MLKNQAKKKFCIHAIILPGQNTKSLSGSLAAKSLWCVGVKD